MRTDRQHVRRRDLAAVKQEQASRLKEARRIAHQRLRERYPQHFDAYVQIALEQMEEL